MKQKILHYFVPGSLTVFGLVMTLTGEDWILRLIGSIILFVGAFLAHKKYVS